MHWSVTSNRLRCVLCIYIYTYIYINMHTCLFVWSLALLRTWYQIPTTQKSNLSILWFDYHVFVSRKPQKTNQPTFLKSHILKKPNNKKKKRTGEKTAPIVFLYNLLYQPTCRITFHLPKKPKAMTTSSFLGSCRAMAFHKSTILIWVLNQK